MAVNYTDFEKIWASTSPLTPYSFSDANYKRGWDFIGATPPSRQMWDAFMRTADEKSQWLYNETVRINQIVIQGIPVGVIQAFAGSTTPDGWLLCDGSAVSRTDYSELFLVIGTTYGDGDGSTTFNVPNLIDKFVQGNATAGTVKSAGLPNISGHVGWRKYAADGRPLSYRYAGAFYEGSDIDAPSSICAGQESNKSLTTVEFDASRVSSVYGNSTTVQPPAVTMRYIIKY